MPAMIDNGDTFCGFYDTHETTFERDEYLFYLDILVSIIEEICKGEFSTKKPYDSNQDAFD